MKNRILDFLTSGSPWAIQKGSLEEILRIARRENDLEAVLKERGEPLENTRKVEVRSGVAVIPVNGPLFPRANLFAEISGAYSVEMLALDLAAAEADPDVRAVVLSIDSPGGHTKMINEFANQVAAFNKPIAAYVVGTAASAAYWIASAADKIIVDDTAVLGSIGVVAALEPDDDGQIVIVSSHAPDKRPDLETDEGLALIQALVDDTEAVFIEAVMRFRGLEREQITALRGGVVVGAKAVEAGLADELGSLEGVISLLQQENPMDLETLKADHPDVFKAVFDQGAASVNADQLRAEGGQDERARIIAILNDEAAEGREAQAQALALETDLAPEAALKVLVVSPKVEAQKTGDQFSRHMDKLGNPDVGADSGQGDDDTVVAMAGWNKAFNKARGK